MAEFATSFSRKYLRVICEKVNSLERLERLRLRCVIKTCGYAKYATPACRMVSYNRGKYRQP